MRVPLVGLILLTIAGLGACAGTGATGRSIVTTPGPVRTTTTEPGVVPEGTTLVIRTEDTVNASRALRGTVYVASVAEDVLDQSGTVLLPRESPVELVVRSVPYLGPGGVGMTELILEVQSVTVNGVRYPVSTDEERPGSGGLRLHRYAAKAIGAAKAGEIVTSGHRITVPTRTLLAFQVADPIRLRGFRR